VHLFCRVQVLVLHFPFENTDRKRHANELDVARLENCFNEYKNCEFRALTPKEPIETILSQNGLEETFNSTAGSSSNAKQPILAGPDVFILIIMSYGGQDGLINSDNSGCPDFTTFDVWNALKSNQTLKDCIKINFFGVSCDCPQVSFLTDQTNFSQPEEVTKRET
jgi:hypothetical protein